jgi:zinc transporter ZupT
MISTLAGVCKRVRLRRLPLPAVWFNVSVGAASAAGAVAEGVAAAAAATRFFPPRMEREAFVLLDWRWGAADVGFVTTIGSSVWLGFGALCDHPSSGQRTDERATEYSKDVRRDARKETEFMV